MDIQEKEKAWFYKVTKSNDLIQKSRFELTTTQQKLILFLISKIKPSDDDFKLCEFSIHEFCAICGIDEYNGGNYIAIKQAIEDIAQKFIWVTLDNEEETMLRWIEKPYINKKTGIIKIRFDKDMKPFLLQLKSNFTQYELFWTIQFKSKYSIRMYEYFKSVHYNKELSYERIFTVEELRKILGAQDVHKEWKNFKARVLEPAIEEINNFSNQYIEYQAMTTGRTVDKVWIKVTEREFWKSVGKNRLIENEE